MSGARSLLLPSEGTLIAEHFVTNDQVSDNNIGINGFQVTTIGNAPTVAYRTGVKGGGARFTTAATADGDGGAIHSFPDGLVVSPGFEWGAKITRPVELASLNWRFGLDDSVTATRPTKGVTIESDAGVLSCCTDSAASGDRSQAVTKHPDLTSGTTEVVAQPLVIQARGSGKANATGGPDEVDFFINGKHVVKLPCLIGITETVEPKFAFWQDSGGADAVIIDVDYMFWYFPL